MTGEELDSRLMARVVRLRHALQLIAGDEKGACWHIPAARAARAADAAGGGR